MPVLGSFGGGRGFGRSGAVKPLAPTINSVTDVGTNRAFNNGALSVAITPNGPTPDFYNFWAVAPNNSEIPGGSTSSTTLVVGGLSSNVQYTVKVVAVVNNVASDFATFTTPTLVTTVPAAPTIGTATDVGTGRSVDNAAATVTFTPGATGGKAQTFKVFTSDGTERGSGSSSPLTASGIDTTLGSSHAFNVRAVNANGESQASNTTSNTTLTTVPGGPSVTVDSTSGTTVNFSFSVPTTGGKTVTSTRIYIMSAGSELATTTVSAASGTGSFVLSELTTDDAFLWGQATNANGAGGFGLGGTAIKPSAAPTFSIFRPSSTSATVTITNYNAAFSYSVATTSGSAARSGETVSVTGASSGAFNVTVTANQGAFFINRSATAAVPVFSSPTWYGAACCSTSGRIVASSASSEAAVIDSLDAQCGGTITEQTVIVLNGPFNEANYPATSCAVVDPGGGGGGGGGTPPDPDPEPEPPAPTCSGNCTAGTVGNTQNCGAATASCVPAGCAAGCTVTCTNYCSSAAASPGQTITASGPCGSFTVTAAFPGARAVIRCCAC